MPDQETISSTSQNFLDIFDITNDVILLKNGSCSLVLTVNAMNFGLLAEQEQDAVIYAYAGLLNSLNFPIQILVQSQTKDASTYLKLLKKQEENIKDEIKQAWIRRYSQFVNDLIKERNVLDKKFYVIIPASSLEMGLTPGQNIVSGFKEQSIEGIEKSVILEKAKNLLEPKKDHLIAQFNRIGLYARQLTTQEIIRLFYTNYNPEATEGQQITNSQSYTTALVEAQIRGEFMNNQPPQNKVEPAAPMAAANPTPVEPAVSADPAPATPVPTVSPTPAVDAPVVAPAVGEVDITESPTIQSPAAVSPVPAPVEPVTAPMAAPTPMTPPPASTVEITKPDAAAPAMPTPTKPMSPPQPAGGAATEVKPAESEEVAQKNINSTLEQLTPNPTT
jgi:hypothetical protein